MSKKRVRKLFSLFIFLLLGGNTLTAQQSKEATDCVWMAGGKKMPFFSPLAEIRKNLIVSRNIDDLDTMIFSYWYDGKIIKFNKLLFTPQLLFFVDTSKKETIKQVFYYTIERPKEDGGITRRDIKNIFKMIRAQNIPFLRSPENADFGSTYKFNSICHPYSIEISKVKDEDVDKGRQEFTVTISMRKYDNEKKLLAVSILSWEPRN